MTDRYEESLDVLAHEIWAAAQLAPGEGVVDGVARVAALLRKGPHPATTHCDNCGCDWLDNGLNPIGCPYCKQSASVDKVKEPDLWRCTVCGRVGTVGRCCGEETRERVNMEQLLAENERLRDEVERLRTDGASAVRWAPSSAHWSEVLKELFGPDARKGIDALETRWRKELERAERLAEVLSKILENEASDWKAAEEFGGYVLDVELREEARAVLSKENTNET